MASVLARCCAGGHRRCRFCIWRSEAIAEGALSVHVLSAGGALTHHDLIDEEVDEEVVSEPSERLELHLDLRLVHLLHLARERGCHTDMHRQDSERATSALTCLCYDCSACGCAAAECEGIATGARTVLAHGAPLPQPVEHGAVARREGLEVFGWQPVS